MYVISSKENKKELFAVVDYNDITWEEDISKAIQFNRKKDAEAFWNFADCFDEDEDKIVKRI